MLAARGVSDLRLLGLASAAPWAVLYPTYTLQAAPAACYERFTHFCQHTHASALHVREKYVHSDTCTSRPSPWKCSPRSVLYLAGGGGAVGRSAPQTRCQWLRV